MLARRGFRARYQLIGYTGWSPEQHWAYWATHVNNVRFGPREHPVYAQLRQLVRDKDAFVLTSNVDAMFERNAFDPAQIFTPQGDYAAMQCRKPCGRVVWPSQPAVDRVLAHVDRDAFEVTDPAALPACPTCGGEVFLNVRLDRGVRRGALPAPTRAPSRLVGVCYPGRLLLLEIGAGFNTPTVVRWQMERMAQVSPHARLVRINRDEADLGDAPNGRALAVPGDAGEVIEALARTCG